MKAKDLVGYFAMFLEESDDFPDKSASLKALHELADRQWHTYALLDSDIRNKIDQYVVTLIDSDLSLKDYNYLGGVISNLGLKLACKKLQEHYDVVTDQTIKARIKESLDEWADTIDDLYSGMKG